MDLETENRIAKALIEEARRMRTEAEKEGVDAYLRKPGVRARPNSRFLTATVLGVQQANRVVEVNEMWRARKKEQELQNKHNSRSKERSKHHSEFLKRSSSDRSEHERGYHGTSCSSRSSDHTDFYADGDRRGLQDDEIEQFLRARVKRGRGEIGSRMDEPGPYLHPTDLSDSSNVQFEHEQARRVLGPEKPLSLRSSSEKNRKEKSSSKDKKKKEKKEKKEKHKQKKRKEERSKHRHKSRSE
ncbi:G patch domain protein [Rhynchospora pubera]|uniref:G patch domain protein n=1 Tax=Rhynchospora pubera TaxID=906938 RepID=A0AAV8E4L2_9POAL|nr:G patch domain protein [Rhynchospora pubera]